MATKVLVKYVGRRPPIILNAIDHERRGLPEIKEDYEFTKDNKCQCHMLLEDAKRIMAWSGASFKIIPGQEIVDKKTKAEGIESIEEIFSEDQTAIVDEKEVNDQILNLKEEYKTAHKTRRMMITNELKNLRKLLP